MPKALSIGFDLNGDVLYYVFVHLTSFSALRTTLLISRSFYVIYNAHPNAIKRAVAENVIGPILDEALDFIRNQYSKEMTKSKPKVQVLEYLKRWRCVVAQHHASHDLDRFCGVYQNWAFLKESDTSRRS